MYSDPLRHGIWCFHLVAKDGAALGASYSALGAAVEVCGYKLGLVEDGSFEPIGLLKSRSLAANTSNAPNSSSSSASALDTALRNAQSFSAPSSQASGNLALDLDSRTASAAMSEAKSYASATVKDAYEYFISAVLSSLVSAFCARAGAIPPQSQLRCL